MEGKAAVLHTCIRVELPCSLAPGVTYYRRRPRASSEAAIVEVTRLCMGLDEEPQISDHLDLDGEAEARDDLGMRTDGGLSCFPR